MQQGYPARLELRTLQLHDMYCNHLATRAFCNLLSLTNSKKCSLLIIMDVITTNLLTTNSHLEE